MGQQIVKQPNGLYAIFSSVVDGFVAYDLDRTDVLEYWVREYRATMWPNINRKCDIFNIMLPDNLQFPIFWNTA